ncbi:MAG: 3-methyl-2-oxobutanoate hydroxymethyltransferase [Pseudomonadota bacterium]|jgi:3-methyl-2-oxobutanoate hydroxymethyltransferase
MTDDTVISLSARKPITVPALRQRRQSGPAIAMLTCYDACFARVLDEAEVDVLLVGDSLGMVLQGHETTVPVALEEMIYHTKSVARARPKSLIMTDMPFGSYQESPEQAYRNAAKLIASGAQMVKLEGGSWLAPTVEFLRTRDVPVCAHVGLTPQSIHALGTYRVQGKDDQSAERIVNDAKLLEHAGAEMLVVELVPSNVGARLTSELSIPTIGIGAGPHTTGQVLVLHDMLGISKGKRPRFVKDFLGASGGGDIATAISQYVAQVRAGAFPSSEHSFEQVTEIQRIVNRC